jgi:DNA-3-methyladenine glycosylase I
LYSDLREVKLFGAYKYYYHDNEWGRPVHDDVWLFEMLVLEDMQARAYMDVVLKKREVFREAFDGFDPKLVALYDTAKVQELMTNQKNNT